MGNEEDDDCFFDAPEQEEQVASSSSSLSQDFGLQLWTQDPDSVSNRRRKFFQTMGFSFKKSATDEIEEPPNSLLCGDGVKEVDLLLRNESTTWSSVSSSSEDTDLLSRNDSSSSTQGLSESGSFGDFQSSPSTSIKKGGAKSWLKKLRHVLDSIDCESVGSPLKRIARVQTFKKQFKELSSLCIDQEFSAHDGSILAMKFSPDGKYIASAGEDCVVRVWSIVEEEPTDEYQVPEVDSGVYFGMNQHSQIEPLKINNEKTEKKTTGFLRKSPDSICVVLPSKIFSISEKPLHEFVGHVAEILDLSWSDKGVNIFSNSSYIMLLSLIFCG